MKIGFMQGRLLKSENSKYIQYFPSRHWIREINLAKKIRFDLMEWTANLENLKQNPVYDFNKAMKAKEILKKNKIKVYSLTCDFFMQKPFFRYKRNENYLEILKKVVKVSQYLGIRFFVIPLVDNSSIKYRREENILIREMLDISKILKKNSMILFETDYKPEKVLKFIRKFNNKFGINYDTGNSASLGFSFEKEKKYFRYVKNIHIKDRLKNGKTVRLGLGNWNYKEFFKYIKKNYNGNLILQTARSNNKLDKKEILINKKFVKKFL
jgi:sugar phosphate isomerase/epimerase